MTTSYKIICLELLRAFIDPRLQTGGRQVRFGTRENLSQTGRSQSRQTNCLLSAHPKGAQQTGPSQTGPGDPDMERTDRRLRVVSHICEWLAYLALLACYVACLVVLSR